MMLLDVVLADAIAHILVAPLRRIMMLQAVQKDIAEELKIPEHAFFAGKPATANRSVRAKPHHRRPGAGTDPSDPHAEDDFEAEKDSDHGGRTPRRHAGGRKSRKGGGFPSIFAFQNMSAAARFLYRAGGVPIFFSGAWLEAAGVFIKFYMQVYLVIPLIHLLPPLPMTSFYLLSTLVHTAINFVPIAPLQAVLLGLVVNKVTDFVMTWDSDDATVDLTDEGEGAHSGDHHLTQTNTWVDEEGGGGGRSPRLDEDDEHVHLIGGARDLLDTIDAAVDFTEFNSSFDSTTIGDPLFLRSDADLDSSGVLVTPVPASLPIMDPRSSLLTPPVGKPPIRPPGSCACCPTLSQPPVLNIPPAPPLSEAWAEGESSFTAPQAPEACSTQCPTPHRTRCPGAGRGEGGGTLHFSPRFDSWRDLCTTLVRRLPCGRLIKKLFWVEFFSRYVSSLTNNLLTARIYRNLLAASVGGGMMMQSGWRGFLVRRSVPLVVSLGVSLITFPLVTFPVMHFMRVEHYEYLRRESAALRLDEELNGYQKPPSRSRVSVQLSVSPPFGELGSRAVPDVLDTPNNNNRTGSGVFSARFGVGQLSHSSSFGIPGTNMPELTDDELLTEKNLYSRNRNLKTSISLGSWWVESMFMKVYHVDIQAYLSSTIEHHGFLALYSGWGAHALQIIAFSLVGGMVQNLTAKMFRVDDI